MSVLVYIESENLEVKKSSFEAAAYAVALANQLETSIKGVANGKITNLADLATVGLTHVITVGSDLINAQDSGVQASFLKELVDKEAVKAVIMPNSSLTEGVAARLSIKCDATAITNVIGLPDTREGFVVKKSVYTSKAFSNIDIKSDVKILTVKKNSFEYAETSGEFTSESVTLATSTDSNLTILEIKKQEGDILLPEADLVVSAGRGLKGPENWGLIEDLAKTLGAATACSKPVSDMDWRPHHEHVGQTGIKVSPNLYIAIGISGAIQHLAGVSSSKVIVVINTDEEAPFFKAADYGVVGDAFEVVPRLTEALKNA